MLKGTVAASSALAARAAVIALAAAGWLAVAGGQRAVGDIFQWAWVDPADPSQGKFESDVLSPDGLGRDATPRAFLRDLDLTQAYLIGANLWASHLADADFTIADLTGADLRAWLPRATLTGAQLADDVASHSTGIYLCQTIRSEFPHIDAFCISVVSDMKTIRMIERLGVRFLRKGETPLRTVLNMIRSRLTGVAYDTSVDRKGRPKR